MKTVASLDSGKTWRRTHVGCESHLRTDDPPRHPRPRLWDGYQPTRTESIIDTTELTDAGVRRFAFRFVLRSPVVCKLIILYFVVTADAIGLNLMSKACFDPREAAQYVLLISHLLTLFHRSQLLFTSLAGCGSEWNNPRTQHRTLNSKKAEVFSPGSEHSSRAVLSGMWTSFPHIRLVGSASR